MKQIDEDNDEPRMKVEELIEVSLNGLEATRKVLIGALLTGEARKELVEFLKRNHDVFSWSYKVMPRD